LLSRSVEGWKFQGGARRASGIVGGSCTCWGAFQDPFEFSCASDCGQARRRKTTCQGCRTPIIGNSHGGKAMSEIIKLYFRESEKREKYEIILASSLIRYKEKWVDLPKWAISVQERITSYTKEIVIRNHILAEVILEFPFLIVSHKNHYL
jgi:hypothetical protein